MTMVVKRVRSKVEILLPAVLCLILIFSSCSPETRKPPLPVNGVLDLRNWDFKGDGSIRLKGYWEFCFDKFLLSAQFDSLQEKNYSWVSGVWKRQYVHANPFDTVEENRSHPWPLMPWENYYWNGKKLGATGYASYRLIILFPPGPEHLACKIPDEGTAYSFFIDDSLVASSGKIGTSKENSMPQYLPQTVVMKKLKDTTSLTVWISNFHYRKGGMWKEITINDAEAMSVANKNELYTQLFIEGVWFMVCFTFLFFYLNRPSGKTLLFLLLGSISCLIRSMMADSRLITEIYPGINWELMVKLELITGFTCVQFTALALYELFPKEFSKWFRNFVAVAILVLVSTILFTRSFIYSNLVVPYQVMQIFIIFYSMIRLIKCLRLKREGSLILELALTLMLVMSGAQFLFYNQIMNSRISDYYLLSGMTMAFAQILLIARIFSANLKRVENFAGELEVTVAERTRELVAAQEQLLQVARQTENEKIRRRISQDIHDDISSGLNKISWMGELVKIKAQKNSPEEINPALDKIIKASRETVDHLIEIIWSLNPANDDLENMLSYVRNYVNRFFDETPFNVRINFPELVTKVEINPELKRNIFLVIKEALHNAAKYSKAENITLDFQYHDPAFTFIINDDGVGMEDGVIRGSGHGMVNMQKRMESVNGKFTVETGQGIGTRIILEGSIY
jgi:signal transduction histidine kinase